MRIPSPHELHTQLPLSQQGSAFLENARKQAVHIFQKKSKKRALLIGPCSIHDPLPALDYAARLKELSNKTEHFFLIMRLFLEKPRSRKGWKGLIYDPRLDGSNDICFGLHTSRKLLLDLANLNVPCATELLEPLAIPYIEDLITWGMIGARTSASQPHRQLASGLSFPVGFKNGVHGELDVAIHGILAAQDSHTHLSIDDKGRICAKKTTGNPLTHLVLRGSEIKTNYDPISVAHASDALRKNHLTPSILIDCSHGNSTKDHKLQSQAFKSVINQIYKGNENIAGLMLESHILEGNQPLGNNPSALLYGVSITDPCIGWEETESLILWADEYLSSRPISINSVQN
jgi:3-deoxy-7-phosphoheptulonate synthase